MPNWVEYTGTRMDRFGDAWTGMVAWWRLRCSPLPLRTFIFSMALAIWISNSAFCSALSRAALANWLSNSAFCSAAPSCGGRMSNAASCESCYCGDDARSPNITTRSQSSLDFTLQSSAPSQSLQVAGYIPQKEPHTFCSGWPRLKLLSIPPSAAYSFRIPIPVLLSTITLSSLRSGAGEGHGELGFRV